MTRINVDLNPKLLTDQHLLAEYREIPMVPAALRRSLKTKSVGDVLAGIPKEFTLNKGHVKFFYDKMAFLESRYESVVKELISRGYSIDLNRTYGGSDLPYIFRRNCSFTKNDRKVLTDRIIERVAAKPSWYKQNGKSIVFDEYVSELENN